MIYVTSQLKLSRVRYNFENVRTSLGIVSRSQYKYRNSPIDILNEIVISMIA